MRSVCNSWVSAGLGSGWLGGWLVVVACANRPVSAGPAPTSSASAVASTSAAAASRRASAEDERDAIAICALARRHLALPPAEVRKNLPADWAELLPIHVAAPEFDARSGEFLARPWRVRVEGDSARMSYVPAAGMNANFRAWFELAFERVAGRWQLAPAGVTFSRAHRRGH